MIQFAQALDELNDTVRRMSLPKTPEQERRLWNDYQKQYHNLRLALQVYQAEMKNRQVRR